MKAGTHNHVKTKRLKRLLGIPLYQAVGILETLWLLCTDCCDEGNIGKFTDEEIADYLEWDGSDSFALVQALLNSGWLDRCDVNRYVIHDWLEHCPQYIKDRLRMRESRVSKANKITTYASPEPNNTEHSRTNHEQAGECHVSSKAGQGNSNQSQPKLIVSATPDVVPGESKKPKTYSDDRQKKFARMMFAKIQELDPDHKLKEPNYSIWANEIRLMEKVDGRELNDAWDLFLAANSHEFWQTQILSPSKFRKQYDALHLKLRTSAVPQSKWQDLTPPRKEQTA